ncbi:purine nucleosidase protein [Halorhabdus tiamatea SARL4B]|uniref:Inosine-uridine preferring nucleoside hydrolase n=1 Tax=Halorhabdus tiamatea SARL4B TaxID=1033806 RepID=F7PN43_9EURY|nr:nucleoside hydrolase [Halorhabdus tiamatea]ERJ07757.1 purine nucleosidase protein [Halorhabdus tiamatea SARL4B]CCQ32584.1 inosine-uridine preferring nucleoside hydrolase [Halorhabdus tiamatea SARL4B]
MADRVIIDTDTATDDTLAILLAVLSDRVDVEALTIAAGNVAFDRQVENAKYTLDLADVAGEIPVYEGARSPLVKDHDHATDVHGEGGLGPDLVPETDVPSAAGFGPEYIVEAAREHPGEITLVCLAPLTNVALALEREPKLGELLADVVVMGGNVHSAGNVTPAAEFNVWADPDAAKIVLDELAVTLVDWGLTLRDGTLDGSAEARITDAAGDSEFAAFYETVFRPDAEGAGDDAYWAGTAQPDALASAVAVFPELIEQREAAVVDVDEREGLTRGSTIVDTHGITDREPRTDVITSVDADGFQELLLDTVVAGDPDRSFE